MASREFEPGKFERLHQARAAMGLMPEKYIESIPSSETVSLDSKLRSIKSELVLRWGALALAILGAFSAGFGQVEEKQKSDPESLRGPSSVSGEQWEENVEPFLSYPVPRDERIKIVQGWIYQGYHQGETHRGVDYIQGQDLTNSDTWKTFPVLAAADGLACLDSFATLFGTRNNRVKIKHANGYETRYLHLRKSSLESRREQFPSCGSRQDSWLFIRRGDKIADAGDSGTFRGWIHLHFALRDRQGYLIDPYDLYYNRTIYPNVTSTNIRYCGPDALFFEEICPRASVLGDRVTAEPKATPVPKETPTWQEAIANLGNWQLAVVDWQESEYQYIEHGMYGDPQKNYRDGWKFVTVSTRVRNIDEPIYFNGEAARGRRLFDLYLISGQFPGEKYVGVRDFDPVEFQVPIGFSYPQEFGFWIPEGTRDYSLVVEGFSAQDRQEIEHGETARDFERIDSLVDLKNPGFVWEIPGRVSVEFDRIFINQCPIENCTYFQEQFASFEITNESGQDIKTGYGFGTGFEMKVFLPDGRVIEDSELFYSSEPRVSSPDVIEPGQTKRVDLNFGRTYRLAPRSQIIHGQLFDTSGAVVVLFFDNQWAAWQLP